MKEMNSQRGNALFLILIAVALFAALSYAVTQSGRGGGTVDKENAMIAAGQITQYPAGLRTAVTRMILTGTAATTIKLDTTATVGVFAPDGGGAVSETPPSGIGNAAAWSYSSVSGATGFYVKDVGTNTDGTGFEALASLYDVSVPVCAQINKGLGLSSTIAQTSDTPNPEEGQGQATYMLGDNVIDAIPGQAFACISEGGHFSPLGYIYYHTLIEQ